MPFLWGAFWGDYSEDAPRWRPDPCVGKRRGVTQSPKRKKRRNRRKP
jgi:hypothetical protein